MTTIPISSETSHESAAGAPLEMMKSWHPKEMALEMHHEKSAKLVEPSGGRSCSHGLPPPSENVTSKIDQTLVGL